ncbi:hypothetical protein CCHR01_14348 [Colletotrichum chrysophilum]|uniref:Uncharacterized protein n=1 Tax=Colletotrichum chrysophilum TaxID=1836956 RepID=A0AAD9A7Q5_9PEZI|nr:hypothetical protein CCHR01_14348 [Colletotrichum chrysophilum]
MSNDRHTQGERMSCGILPRDLAGQLRGCVVVAVSSEALGTFSWNQWEEAPIHGRIEGRRFCSMVKAGLYASPCANMGPWRAQTES